MPEALRFDRCTVRRAGALPIGPADFAVDRGEIVALIGPNGAGKTSLVRAALGLVRHEGRCLVDGTDVATLDAATRARRLAWVPQRSMLDAGLTSREVVAMARFAYDGVSDVRHPSVTDALRLADVEAYADRPFPQLSLGEQRRILIARAIASDAPVLLLDEPDAAFDVAHRLMLARLLRDLRDRGRAILLVAHGLEDLRRLADRCVLLHRGVQIATGTPAEVLTDARLLDVFGVHVVPNGADAYSLPEAPT